MTERKHEKLEETDDSKNQIACVITRERETVVPVKVELELPTGIKTIPLVVLATNVLALHVALWIKQTYCNDKTST